MIKRKFQKKSKMRWTSLLVSVLQHDNEDERIWVIRYEEENKQANKEAMHKVSFYIYIAVIR